MSRLIFSAIALGACTAWLVGWAIGLAGVKITLPGGASMPYWPPSDSTAWFYQPLASLGGSAGVILHPTRFTPAQRALVETQPIPSRDLRIRSLDLAPDPNIMPIVPGEAWWRAELLTGWPFFSQSMAIDAHPTLGQRPIGGSLLGSWNAYDYDYRAMPSRPLWVGLASNTLVYAMVWLLILLGLARVIARIRINRRDRVGRCVSRRCGYRLEGLQTCPECGTVQPVGP